MIVGANRPASPEVMDDAVALEDIPKATAVRSGSGIILVAMFLRSNARWRRAGLAERQAG